MPWKRRGSIGAVSDAAITPPLIFGIETSCDDTACAVVDGRGRVLSSVVSSQLAAHGPYGGVVPEIASREHLVNWPAVCEEALGRAGVGLEEIDLVAATRGPGLVGALLVGLSLGRSLAYGLGRPFHAIHHLEAHLYSPLLATPADAGAAPAEETPEEFVGLVVSGGHTSLFQVSGAQVSTLAETRDDAIGEVFDKVGKGLGLAYPQGPKVDALAERGEAGRFTFAVPRFGDGSLDFSYSGLKSQTLREVDALRRLGVDCDLSDGGGDADGDVLDLLAGFREAAVRQVLHRLERFRRSRGFGLLAVSGGAAANRLLRRELVTWAEEKGVDLRLVPLAYAGDNAAMIAHAALLRHQRGLVDDPLSVEAASRIPI